MYFAKLITITIASMAAVATANPHGINGKPENLAARDAASEENQSAVRIPRVVSF